MFLIDTLEFGIIIESIALVSYDDDDDDAFQGSAKKSTKSGRNLRKKEKNY